MQSHILLLSFHWLFKKFMIYFWGITFEKPVDVHLKQFLRQSPPAIVTLCTLLSDWWWVIRFIWLWKDVGSWEYTYWLSWCYECVHYDTSHCSVRTRALVIWPVRSEKVVFYFESVKISEFCEDCMKSSFSGKKKTPLPSSLLSLLCPWGLKVTPHVKYSSVLSLPTALHRRKFTLINF